MFDYKKLLVKLTGWKEQRMNLGKRRFRENESVERENAREREEAQKARIKGEQGRQWEEVKIPEDQERRSDE